MTLLAQEHLGYLGLVPGEGGLGVGFYGGGGGGGLVTTPGGQLLGDDGQSPEEGEGRGFGAGGTTSTNGAALLEIIYIGK